MKPAVLFSKSVWKAILQEYIVKHSVKRCIIAMNSKFKGIV